MTQQSTKNTAKPQERQLASLNLAEIELLRQEVLRRIDKNLDEPKEPKSLSIWDAICFEMFPTLPSTIAMQEEEEETMDETEIIRRSWELTGDYLRLGMLDYEVGLRQPSPMPKHR